MRIPIFLGLTAAVVLAGCAKHDGGAGKTATNGNSTMPGLPPLPGSGTGSGSVGGGGGTSGVTGNTPLQPGMWETTFSVNSFKAINLRPEDTGGAADAFGDVPFTPPPSRHDKICLSAAEAAKGAPAMMSGSGLPSCRWEKLATPPGSIEGALICGQPTDHNVVRASVTGALLPNLIGTHLSMTIGDPAGVHMVGDAMMQGQRVGDCPSGAP
ncbi:MAG: DUF3617 family protein [Sphingomonas sp.]